METKKTIAILLAAVGILTAFSTMWIAVQVFLFTHTADVSESSVNANTESTPGRGYVDMTIDGQPVRLDMKAAVKYIELPTLNCEKDITVTMSGDDAYSAEFNGVSIGNGESISYRVPRLDKNDVILIKVTDNITGETQTFIIPTWPSFVPEYTVVGESPYEGDYYLTTLSHNGDDHVAMKVGRGGELKYYLYNQYGCVADFKKVVAAEGVRYLHFTTISTRRSTKGVSQSGCYVVMDENYHEINRLFMKKSERVPTDDYPVDQHDCIYISDNEYYLISYVDKNVYNIPEEIEHKANGSLVTAAVIQGIKNGEVFFEWDSTDYPELYSLSVDYNDFTNSVNTYSADYMHINSISLCPEDGNLIASFRNIDSVLKIDVNSGDILWKLSGLGDEFGLGADQKTSRQHYANYTDLGSVTIFDNGNENKQTRVVEYWLDENHKSLENFRSYQIDGYFSYATGSVQRISRDEDVFMVGWGFRNVGNDGENSLYPQFSEINFTTGETYFEFRFQDPNMCTYRCVKCP